jgi:hypothetical protein
MGKGYAAYGTVGIVFVDSVNGKTVLGYVNTDATGAFLGNVTVPQDASVGKQQVAAIGDRRSQHARTKFTVT